MNTRKPDSRYRVINMKDNGLRNFCNNIFNRYEKRPLTHENYDFENMSLLQFATLFEPFYNRSKRIEDDNEGDKEACDVTETTHGKLITLIDNSKMRVGTRPAVLRCPYFDMSKDREAYFYSLLVQHLPFRNDFDLLAGYDNAERAFSETRAIIMESNGELGGPRKKRK